MPTDPMPLAEAIERGRALHQDFADEAVARYCESDQRSSRRAAMAAAALDTLIAAAEKASANDHAD